MYTDDIYEAAGVLNGAETESLYPFCLAAEKELTDRLRNGIFASDCEEVFIQAAALLALSIYRQVQDSAAGEVASYRAGEVAVTMRAGSSVDGAETLRRQAERMMIPYIADDAFIFRGVDG